MRIYILIFKFYLLFEIQLFFIYYFFINKMFRSNSNPRKKKFYNFYVNNHIKNKSFSNLKSNYISTTKYNCITFLPKSLLLQFTRLPNVYFLLIAILQSIPAISPLNSVTAILPLVFVLSVSMLRELIEDISRYKFDKINNNRKVIVLKEGEFIEDISENIQVGDIILVNENTEFPCDLILLDSTNVDGICYIETGTLDGEKNLKNKISNKEIKGKFYQGGILTNSFIHLKGKVQCDMPNPELYKFDGKMSLLYSEDNNSISGNDDIDNLNYVLTASQLLLKGAFLRQTKQISGIVVYTGSNNKILLNSKNPKMKLSKIERTMNTLLIFIFFLQLALCLICAFIHDKYQKKNHQFLTFFIFPQRKVKNESFLSFFTYLLLLNTMIPISLIVTLEIIKVIQGLFIGFDVELFSFIRQKFCGANSVSIIEELGKINYIFSDKTGTLTCNKMEFKYCVIGNLCFEYIRNENPVQENYKIKINMEKNINFDNLINNNFPSNPPNYNNSNSPVTDKSRLALLSGPAPTTDMENKEKLPTKKDIKNIIQFNSGFMYDIVSNKNPKFSKVELQNINNFWMALSIGNECIPFYNEKTKKIEYNGLSPDDIELVRIASDQGYQMVKSPNDIKRIKFGNSEKPTDYKILNVISFTSDRKRMSIIIKDQQKNIIMYIKGADSEIKKRLSQNNNKKYFNYSVKFTDYFSSKGYRTLFIGYKKLSEKEYLTFSTKLRKAELNLDKKDILVNECYNEIENNFLLLGVTIVEDKLQDEVPETIRDLRYAGIKIWMLTGDKVDTAENIALSCNLISKENRNFKLDLSSNIRDNIIQFFNDFGRYNNMEISFNENEELTEEENEKEIMVENNKIKPFSLIIESSILGYIFSNKNITNKFLKIALSAESVVCCRVSPLQKSQVVKEVKNLNDNFITLSIGDGGNDVSMIMEAHVGVGIYGEEGMLAVQSSDFSIGEFKFLRRLLFFHGRNSLNRIGNMILYFFFKNFAFTILQFYFTFYNIASGQSLIDDWFIACFNLIFTALPLGVQALTNFDILCLDFNFVDNLMPLLYKESNFDSVFTIGSFIANIIKAIFYSIINYYVILFSSWKSSINNKGDFADIWFNSLCIYTNIIFVVSFSLLIKQLYWVWFFPFILFLTSWCIYFGFCCYAQTAEFFNSNGGIFLSFESLKFWLNIFLVSGICFIFDLFFHSYQMHFSRKLCNELLINREYKKDLNTLFDMSEVIKKAYMKMDYKPIKKQKSLLSKNSSIDKKNSSLSFNSSSSKISGRSIEMAKDNPKKFKSNEANSSFSSSKEQMFDNKNELKILNSNNNNNTSGVNLPIKTYRNSVEHTDNVNTNVYRNEIKTIKVSQYKNEENKNGILSLTKK